jgi:hypothetical protein
MVSWRGGLPIHDRNYPRLVRLAPSKAYQRAGYKTGTVGFEGFEGGERGALSTFVVVSDLIQLVIVHSRFLAERSQIH